MSSLNDTATSNLSQEKFVPTWLYIKQHVITGLKYFGKTTKSDPYSYLGSGRYWNRHLKKHGKAVITLWCHLYTDRETLIDDALSFSRSHNIVGSVNATGKKIWANEKFENGLAGNVIGSTHTTATKLKMSRDRTGVPKSIAWRNSAAERRRGSNNPNFGNIRTKESIELQKQNQPSTKGSNNGRAINWIITSPSGQEFLVCGEMKKFCREHNLSISGMQTIADSGIPSTKGKNVGWMIYRQTFASAHTILINSASAT